VAVRTHVLRLDPIACDGHGICADLLPERISLDEWGYPMIDDAPFDDHLLPYARQAVGHCPVLALRLERIEQRANRSATPRRPS
jgi:ferredoxin